MGDPKEAATSNRSSVDEMNDELKELGRWRNMLKLLAFIFGIVALIAIVALIVVLLATTKTGKSFSTRAVIICVY